MMPASFVSQWRRTFTKTSHGLTVDGISSTSVAVGLVLCEYADWQTGAGIRPGHERVARVVGASRATVKRSVAALVTAGWIESEDRGSFGRASTYRLTIPPLLVIGTGEITPPVTGSPMTPWGEVPETRNGVMGAHLTGSPMTHHLCQTYVRPRALRVVAA